MLIRTLLWFARRILSLRYKVEIRGLEHARGERTLVLPNHVAYIDPVVLILYLWPYLEFRPLLLESVAHIPVLGRFFCRGLRALSIPSFRSGVNSYKLWKAKEALQGVVDGLDSGENFLIYPSGRLQRSGEERVGGASAVWEIAGVDEQANILLVRTTGLWGSLFSWGLEGEQPNLGKGFARGAKILLKNLIFFAPRRRVLVEIEPAPSALREAGDRASFNRTLEEWYNVRGKEPLSLVSYSRWRNVVPRAREKGVVHNGRSTNEKIREEVVREVARLAHRKPEEISLDAHLFNEIGLDSLDLVDLAAALDRDGYHTPDVSLDMMTVGGLVTLLAGEHEMGEWEEEVKSDSWFSPDVGRPDPGLLEGRTIPELFLKTCFRMGRREAAADDASGLRSYRQLKERVLMLADYFRTSFPRESRIGVMLPASVAAQVVVFAIQLSGRIPVIMNWTLGERYIGAMDELSGASVVISSRAFLDRLAHAELSPIHEKIHLLEEVAGRIGLFGLLRSKFWGMRSYSALEKRYNLALRHPDDHAVILFTSGTESMPKGVPLSHGNIISDLRDAGGCFGFVASDIFLGMLPPFHSFGFSVTGCFPLMGGIRVLFSPDPTHARQLCSDIARGGVTTLCAAPTFLRAIFRSAKEGQLSSLRLIVSGAERAPAQLYESVREMGADLLEGYGITECAPVVSFNSPGEEHRGVGRLLDSMEIRIVDPESYALRGVGESGLILLRGPNVFMGYIGMTAPWPFVELEEELWYDTGDLGRLDEEGYLTLIGRKKRFVKMGGEMISLPAMEEALLAHAMKEGWQSEPRLAIVSHESEGDRPHLHLFCNFEANVEGVNAALKESGFSNLVRLSCCHHLESIPSLGSGKCDYRTLQEMASQ